MTGYAIFQAPVGEGGLAFAYDRSFSYAAVYEGEIEIGGDALDDVALRTAALEHLFVTFQRIDDDHMPPVDFAGRSLSTGDLVRLGDRWFFCATVGWTEVEPPTLAEHVCDPDGDLAYEGHVAAPGYGVAFRCRSCGRAWLRVGDRWVDPASGPYELRPEDVR